jgi:hypothetical protein
MPENNQNQISSNQPQPAPDALPAQVQQQAYQPEQYLPPTQPQQQQPAQQTVQPASDNYGPRQVSLFTLFAKTFLGLVGGVFGSLVLLIIFLASASVLQPVLSPAEATTDQINPIFIVILMAMIFATSLITRMITPWLLSYTERLRYPRMVTATYQTFIVNLIIFAFTAPIYLSTSTTSLEFTAYAAGLQIVMVCLSSALIMEILNDEKYPLLGVYTSVIGVLIATAVNLFLFQMLKSATVLLFAALPITWASIGFFQACIAMIYYWYYLNWGNDFLASNTSYGTEYAGVQEEVEEEEKELPEDKAGGDFFKS